MAFNSYTEHYLLQFIPNLVISSFVLGLCVFLTFKKKYNTVMDEIVKITIGESFLIDEDDVIDDKEYRSYRESVNANAGFALALAANVFWNALVEKETIGVCEEDADCFVSSRDGFGAASAIFGAERLENCSDFVLENDLHIVCYRAGFYLLEAFGFSGGLLYIELSTTRVLFPFLLQLAGRSKSRRLFVSAILIFGACCIILIEFILVFALPSSALGIATGNGVLPFALIALGLVAMARSVYKYPFGRYKGDTTQKVV